MMNYKLTIAIPTYNRKKELFRCLNSILEQFLENEVEIVVSDNASTDSTQEMMREICHKYSYIKYFRNSKNVGPDANFLQCFKRASGDYILILGDDDILLPGVVKDILQVLKIEPTFVHLNSCIIQNENTYSRPRMVENGIRIFEDKNKFLEEMGIYITYVSSLIFRMDIVNEMDNLESFIGTNFIQSHMALISLSKPGKYIINTKNCVAATGNITVGYDLYETWIKQWFNLIIGAGREYQFDEKVLRRIYKKSLKNEILGFILYYRATCDNEKEWNSNCIWKCINRYPGIKMMYKVVIKCPRGILRKIFLREWKQIA